MFIPQIYFNHCVFDLIHFFNIGFIYACNFRQCHQFYVLKYLSTILKLVKRTYIVIQKDYKYILRLEIGLKTRGYNRGKREGVSGSCTQEEM